LLFKEENVPEVMDASFHTVKMALLLQQGILAEVFAFHSSEVLVPAETLAASHMELYLVYHLLLMWPLKPPLMGE